MMNYPLLSLAAVTILQVTVPGQCGSYENHISTDTVPDTAFEPAAPRGAATRSMLIQTWHDDEFEPNAVEVKNCDECTAAGWAYERNKLQYFKTHVYDPAMKNRHLRIENRRFLQALYKYMIADTGEQAIDYHTPPFKIIRPVFRLKDNMVRVCSFYFNYSTDSFVSSFGLTAEEKSVQYYLFCSNSTAVRPCKIMDETLYRTDCAQWRSNKLYTAERHDTLHPAFCSPFRVVLEHRKDTEMNRLLEERHWCEGNCRWLCGASNLQLTFAQMTGVPNLWFTSDSSDDKGVYPMRALYININGLYALELWRYELDLGSCSCI